MKNILLIGFMGTGKSTISSRLSMITNMSEVDMDAYIVEKEGESIADMFQKHGEEYFRTRETEALIEIQSSDKIVSCGGGVVVKDENVKYMKGNGIVVLLTAKPETVFERVKNSKDRPILNGNMNIEFIDSLMNKRKSRYEAVADIVITTDNRDVNDICKEILEKVGFYKKNSWKN